MNTMIDLQKLPYEIGDKIMHNGKPHTIKGIHLYIGGGGVHTLHTLLYRKWKIYNNAGGQK